MAKVKVVKDTAERWLLTYADLMNLLLIFFIILYAMSQVNKAKFDQLSQSLRQALGTSTNTTFVLPGNSGPSPIDIGAASNSPVISSKLEEQQMDQVKKKVEDLIKEGKLEGKLEVALEERGVNISITAQLLFQPGSADLEPNSKPTIQEIGNILAAIPGHQIRIEGHTDNDPIHNALFNSNWELSSDRATNVLGLLIDKAGIDSKIIAATGFGEMRPIAPNDTPQNKAKNRRVNIVILKSIYDVTDPGASSETNNQAGNGTETTDTAVQTSEPTSLPTSGQ